MKKRSKDWRPVPAALLKLAGSLAVSVATFILGKLLFIAFNPSVYGLWGRMPDGDITPIGFKGLAEVVWHGLPMDISLACYIAMPAALVLSVAFWTGWRKWLRTALAAYYWVVAAFVWLVMVLDTGLYSYWGFKLDASPVFYFLTSPSAAAASAQPWEMVAAPLSWIILTFATGTAYMQLAVKRPGPVNALKGMKRPGAAAVLAVAAALLFVPARGGVTVSTMNVSKVYFSDIKSRNHAAVNPVFTLLSSLGAERDVASRFRYLDADTAQRLAAELERGRPAYGCGTPAASTTLLARRPRVVCIILLESFSSHLFPSLGGEPVALRLDSVAREGLLFTNAWASGFRTDRGIPAVAGGWPSHPVVSVMKHPSATEGLHSLPKALKGWRAEYWYGGDADFTNMRSYLINAGFKRIVSDSDFPVSQLLGKWGAHDHVLFGKLEAENPEDAPGARTPGGLLRIVQTSSSHEPFEVPYNGRPDLSDRRARAFAYTDSVVGEYISGLSRKPGWEETLVVLVPDHYGAWPVLDEPAERHRIPVILTGGALGLKGRIDMPFAQTDIAATLAAALGGDAGSFRHSHNVFDPGLHRRALWSGREYAGLTTDGTLPGPDGKALPADTAVIDLSTGKTLRGRPGTVAYLKAALQTLSLAL